MMCPCLFKPQAKKGNAREGKDLNNNNNNNNNNNENNGKAAGNSPASWEKQDLSAFPGLNRKPDVIMQAVTAQEKPLQKDTKKAPGRPTYVNISNWETGTSLQDSLHHQAKEVHPCRTRACQGSLVNPRGLVRGPRDGPTPKGELLPQAAELIHLFYSSMKEPKTEERLVRLEAVERAIEATGSYQLTAQELAFAARQAWRNAPRCIGRIQWSNLQVFDARSCTTAKEMFGHLCRHLEFATNGGNIRSAITIFPQRTDGKHDFRIWNSQLVRYAGYQMPDGSVVGDPANVDFTQLCLQLGWKPKYGRFDVLPLVLQAGGRDPQLFELPPELVLQVPLEHPTFQWFQELSLKWYAVPAVSNMLLEAGGLEFTACPFNGWYMGTEIGARNLCDARRYNVLQEVGQRMGLETGRLSSLWKDRAATEVNVAVLHSFQKQNVTITDHHSAADSFMAYMQSELRLRGGCPADWVWLVPPLSGSLTPVFHQEMLSYVLSPFYYYQVEAWKTHVWEDDRHRPRRRGMKFCICAKAVLFASTLMRRAAAVRVKATVLYATETGRSASLARSLAGLFSCAFSTQVVCMDDYSAQELEQEALLLVVTSTFGNGDAPSNGKMLQSALLSLKPLRSELRFAVFGLGSSMYPDFCAFARTIYQRLAQLGGSPLSPAGEGDELHGQEEAFRVWAVRTLKAACEAFGVCGRHRIQVPKAYRCQQTWDPKDFRIVSDAQPLDLRQALGDIHGKRVVPMKLKFRQNLQSPKSSRATILVKLSCEAGEEAKYLPGDHLGIFPGNRDALVEGIVSLVADAPPRDEALRLETRCDRGCWAADKRLPACTLSQALRHFLDITTPPSQQMLQTLSQLATDGRQRERLDLLGHDLAAYSAWKSHHSPTVLEVLEEFPSARAPPALLLSQLPLLKPRYYSISSSPDWVPGELHLTVAVAAYRSRGGKGPLRHGVCSSWLNTADLGETASCFVRRTGGFRLPENPWTPCLLVAAGTGVAPFRSFWQQRLHDQERRGVPGRGMSLLFGCRHSGLDHLYKEEMQEMESRGVLRAVHTAYSREPGRPKVYVQDLLRRELGAEVCRLLGQESAHLYVCGDVRMAREVAQTLKEVFERHLGWTEEQAEGFCFQLKQRKQYHEDIFGAVFLPENPSDSEQLSPDGGPSAGQPPDV